MPQPEEARSASYLRAPSLRHGARFQQSRFSAISGDFVFTPPESVCYVAKAGKKSIELRGMPFLFC
jgi:hypothetical protein